VSDPRAMLRSGVTMLNRASRRCVPGTMVVLASGYGCRCTLPRVAQPVGGGEWVTRVSRSASRRAAAGSGVARVRGVPAWAAGVVVRLGGVPARAGGVPARAGGVPARAGGVPARAGGVVVRAASAAVWAGGVAGRAGRVRWGGAVGRGWTAVSLV